MARPRPPPANRRRLPRHAPPPRTNQRYLLPHPQPGTNQRRPLGPGPRPTPTPRPRRRPRPRNGQLREPVPFSGPAHEPPLPGRLHLSVGPARDLAPRMRHRPAQAPPPRLASVRVPAPRFAQAPPAGLPGSRGGLSPERKYIRPGGGVVVRGVSPAWRRGYAGQRPGDAVQRRAWPDSSGGRRQVSTQRGDRGRWGDRAPQERRPRAAGRPGPSEGVNGSGGEGSRWRPLVELGVTCVTLGSPPGRVSNQDPTSWCGWKVHRILRLPAHRDPAL